MLPSECSWLTLSGKQSKRDQHGSGTESRQHRHFNMGSNGTRANRVQHMRADGALLLVLVVLLAILGPEQSLAQERTAQQVNRKCLTLAHKPTGVPPCECTHRVRRPCALTTNNLVFVGAYPQVKTRNLKGPAQQPWKCKPVKIRGEWHGHYLHDKTFIK